MCFRIHRRRMLWRACRSLFGTFIIPPFLLNYLMNNLPRTATDTLAGLVGRINPSQRGSIYSIKMRVITSICPRLLMQHKNCVLGDGKGEMRIGGSYVE